jgi:putative lumazine-binding protein
MGRALHPELAKRIVETDPASGKSVLSQMGAKKLVEYTEAGGGKTTPPARRQADVSILDIYQGAASAKVIAADWVDYLHLTRWNGRWVIVNVLWEFKPKRAAAR